MKQVVVIGAGLAGLSAAYHLSLMGYHCEVYEKDDEVGGLCRTIKKDGYSFDIAGHWFHCKSDYILSLFKKLAPVKLETVKRKTGVYSMGRYTRHPFQTNLKGLPEDVVVECLIEFSRAFYANDDREYENFEDWILRTLGKGIARYFMIPYNLKLWTVEPKEMTCDWMGRFLPKADIHEVFSGAIGRGKHTKAYNASFFYPLQGGIQVLPEALSKTIKDLHLGSEMESIDLCKKRIRLGTGKSIEYDCLINTLPLNQFIRLVDNKNEFLLEHVEKLKHNALLNINLGVNCETALNKNHWVYLPEEGVPYFRAGSYSNVMPSMAPGGKSSLYIECAYDPVRPIDLEELEERCLEKMVSLKMIPNMKSIEVIQKNKIPCAYVIYDKNHKAVTTSLKSFLESNEIFSIGRYGNWEYSSMEDAIQQGIDIAERIRLKKDEL